MNAFGEYWSFQNLKIETFSKWTDLTYQTDDQWYETDQFKYINLLNC